MVIDYYLKIDDGKGAAADSKNETVDSPIPSSKKKLHRSRPARKIATSGVTSSKRYHKI